MRRSGDSNRSTSDVSSGEIALAIIVPIWAVIVVSLMAFIMRRRRRRHRKQEEARRRGETEDEEKGEKSSADQPQIVQGPITRKPVASPPPIWIRTPVADLTNTDKTETETLAAMVQVDKEDPLDANSGRNSVQSVMNRCGWDESAECFLESYLEATGRNKVHNDGEHAEGGENGEGQAKGMSAGAVAR